jgi:crossover junction endodeoxyribonuclease RuvC
VRILGIDCGTVATGYGIIDTDGARHRLVEAGAIRTDTKSPLYERLAQIARGIRSLIETYQPEEAAVEDVFFSVNAQSAIKLAHVRGAVLLVITESGLGVASYSPAEIKASVTGSGAADKSQIRFMLPSLLGVPEAPASPDACDAVAVAICHAVHLPAGAAR